MSFFIRFEKIQFLLERTSFVYSKSPIFLLEITFHARTYTMTSRVRLVLPRMYNAFNENIFPTFRQD